VDKGYLAAMTPVVQGKMALTMSLWGGDAGEMGWLDSPPCAPTDNCDPQSYATWSAFKVTSL
jgi:hypothetical protein